ncbi:NB-ARC domain-containing protein [Actinokineospora auranticolor]|uniref:NB-ARC domain-containing protein n=1 Tax=Actinokineospora auranticolor TaxID=155976 RepID=A0A2S6GBE2_9PSEU|nr:tetratricopeptide repeat protein [Actinokineospora auranticolor]PPK60540.1 NB-ARC domain-containing protein [Actinokineospora auranticolor]
MGADGVRNVLAGVAGQVVQAGSIGTVTFAPEPPLDLVPAQVPAGPSRFVDRVGQLAALRALVGGEPELGRPVVVAVRGMPGVGKSALLRRAATELAGEYPDGALYAAFGADGESTAAALGRLLRGLGIPDVKIPADLAGRRDLYRSRTARTRLITVLDDVTDAAQVEALLPNSAAGLVLVAGNTALEELHVDGAVPIVLEPLDPPDAIDLLRAVCGDGRVDAEPAAAAELVELCGRLPLAICVIGARLPVRPRWTIARLIDDLRDTDLVLDRVTKVADAVHAELPEPARAVYRAVGLLVGPEFGDEVLGAMVGAPTNEVRGHLDHLAAAALIEERDNGQYAMHRLIRAHALRVAAEETTEAERAGQLRRAVDWWLLGATAADVAATGWERLRVADPKRLLADVELTMSAGAALAWFDREHANIAAAMRACAERGWHTPIWQLFEATFAYYDARRPLAAWVETGRLAVEAAALDGAVAAEARCRCLLAKAYQELERFDAAAAELDRAREVAQDERLRGSVHDFTGNLALRTGHFDEALRWFREALDINVRLGRARGTAMQTLFVGRALAGLGRAPEALAAFDEAARLAVAAGADSVVAKSLLATATAYAAGGRPDEAEGAAARAEEIAVRLDNSALRAEIHLLRAEIALSQGDPAAREAHLAAAAAAYERMGSPKAARLLVGLVDA